MGIFDIHTGLSERLQRLAETPIQPLSVASGGQPVDPNGRAVTNVSRVPRGDESTGLGHSDMQVWIRGRGWIDISSIQCIRCADEGRIILDFADEGDLENGPCIVPTEWEYCSCAKGASEQTEDLRLQEEYWESRTRSRNY